MSFLTIVTPRGERSRHEVERYPVRIGRSAGNDLVIPDPSVSRFHAKIEERDEGHFLVDAGAKNPTFLNQKAIEKPARLRPGDRIRLGSTTLIFEATQGTPVELLDDAVPLDSATILTPREISSGALADISPMIDLAAGSEKGLSAVSAEGATTEPGVGINDEMRSALNIILEADRDLTFHRPLDEVLRTILGLAQRAAPYDRGVLLLVEDGELVPMASRTSSEHEGNAIPVSRSVIERVLRNQESIWTTDAQQDERFRSGASGRDLNIRSALCVPIWNNREVIGVLYVDSLRGAGLFTEGHLRVLSHLAAVAALKIENVRLYRKTVETENLRRELSRAAEIQRHMLPSAEPGIANYDVHGAAHPCQTVGGDYYDFIPLEGSRHGIGLGDVAGKGLPAALLMCSVQTSLRAFAGFDLSPEETLSRLNRLLCSSIPDNRFVTFFYGILDEERHLLTYANAGQTPPCLIRPDGSHELLRRSGLPLGLFESSEYTADTLEMPRGGALVCFSDGLSEALDPSGEMFGIERLAAAAAGSHGLPASEMVTEILANVDRHRGEPDPEDDMTLVVVRRIG